MRVVFISGQLKNIFINHFSDELFLDDSAVCYYPTLR